MALVQCSPIIAWGQPRAPEVRVSAEASDDSVRVVVRDNVIGIECKMHARIFGMFERAVGSGRSREFLVTTERTPTLAAHEPRARPHGGEQ